MDGCLRCHAVQAGALRRYPWWAVWRPDWNRERSWRRVRSWFQTRRAWYCTVCGDAWPRGVSSQPASPEVDWKLREDYRHLPDEMRHHPFVFWWDAGITKSPPCSCCQVVPRSGRFFQSQTLQGDPLCKAVTCNCGGLIAIGKSVPG